MIRLGDESIIESPSVIRDTLMILPDEGADQLYRRYPDNLNL